MTRPIHRPECPDCREGLNRREFVSGVTAALAAGSLLPASAFAAPKPESAAENSVRELYKTLTDEQRKVVALPWDDSRRTKVNANWSITKLKIGDLEQKQQELVKQVVAGVTSEDGYGRFLKQMRSDHGGIETYSFAIFGDPSSNQFEFTLTGRHLTLRADGNTGPAAAFGGPIVYGHGAAGNTEGNLFWYQSKRANEVFEMLDSKQRKQALLSRKPAESAVQLREAGSELPGIAGSELTADQRALLQQVLGDIMSPYRQEDVDEVLELVKAGGGFEKMHISFYSEGDLGDDGVWDIWRLESPSLVCHFRGAPHVHAYINVAQPLKQA